MYAFERWMIIASASQDSPSPVKCQGNLLHMNVMLNFEVVNGDCNVKPAHKALPLLKYCTK